MMKRRAMTLILTAALCGTSFSGAAVSVTAAEAIAPVPEEVTDEDKEAPQAVEVIGDAMDVEEVIVADEVVEVVSVSEMREADEAPEDIPEGAITLETDIQSTGELQLAESEELFAEYAERLFYEEIGDEDSFPVYNSGRRTNLTGSAAIIYDAIKTIATRAASGQDVTTEKSFTMKELGLKSQYAFSELGVSGPMGLSAALEETAGVRQAMDALLADLPFELYWFDKERGYDTELSGTTYSDDAVYTSGGRIRIALNVSADYSASGSTGTTALNTKKTGAASAAKTRAQAIVNKHASKTDLQKLTAYRDEICNLTEYNMGAALTNPPYGDPWQLIYVFDGDTDTMVVCEGYTKAFQYLCDLSRFQNNRTMSFIMTGYMDGGRHMWNVVQMDNGLRYLADITNCDMGNRDRLFLKGAPQGDATGYVIDGVVYSYGEETRQIYSATERTLSKADYTADKWIKDKKGWWYQRADKTYPKSKWERIDGKWYYFDASGYMKTGWVKVSGKWYYLNSSGVMQTGWVKVSGKWYYLAPGGAMQTGWVKTGGKWYYMNSSGVMQTGWIKLSGKWYYLASGGAMQTGWLQQGSVWYYMNSSGVMQTGTVRIGGKVHYFTSSGVWVKGVSVQDKLIDVTTFGAIPNDTKSDEVSIKNAINAVGTGAYQDYGGVYIPSGTYKINIDTRGDGVWAQSNTVIVMEDDTILEALPSAIDNYYVLCVKWCENVTIIGGQIIGDRKIHKGTGGESGHGLFIGASSNVNVIGTKVSNCWGDGIYLGISSPGDSACDRINLTGCTISNNRRNNISVVEAHNVTIDHCTISNAYGTAPQCGICVEPNRNAAGKFVPNRNLTIKNTTVTQNKSGVAAYQHFAFMTVDFDNNTDVAATPVTVSNCTFKGDFANFSGKNMTIRNTKVTGTLTYKYDTTMSGVTYGKLQRWWI